MHMIGLLFDGISGGQVKSEGRGLVGYKGLVGDSTV